MKRNFDLNQDYQLDAIKAIVDRFEGQTVVGSQWSVSGYNDSYFPTTITKNRQQYSMNTV
jgi:hypothetical protein